MKLNVLCPERRLLLLLSLIVLAVLLCATVISALVRGSLSASSPEEVVEAGLLLIVAGVGFLAIFLLYFWILDNTILGRIQERLVQSAPPVTGEMFRRSRPLSVLGSMFLPRRFFEGQVQPVLGSSLSASSVLRGRAASRERPESTDRALAVAEGFNGFAMLYADRVRIKRRGVARLLAFFAPADIEIPLQAITEVHFGEPVARRSGYIHFATRMDRFEWRGLESAVFDQHAVVFRPSQRAEFERLFSLVEPRIRASGEHS